MVASLFNRADVRKLLEQIPTDADFDALCLDFFPEVHRRFAAGMERVQKTNLLLELEPDLECIVDTLRQRFPNAAMWAPQRAALLGHAGPMPSPSCAVSGMPQRRPATGLSSDAGTVAAPPGRRIAVDQSGDIHAKGRVSITAPPGAQETLVKANGQLAAARDVNIGVIAPATNPDCANLQLYPRVEDGASTRALGPPKNPPAAPTRRAWPAWAWIAVVLGTVAALGTAWVRSQRYYHPRIVPAPIPVHPVTPAQPALQSSTTAADAPRHRAADRRHPCQKGIVTIRGLAGIRAAALGKAKVELKEPRLGDLPKATVEMCVGQYELYCDGLYERTVTVHGGKNHDEDCQ